jgi:RimJ/RimL family protein N-acetyltransferase
MGGAPIVHATEMTARGEAALRDLHEPDIETIVRYWHGADEAQLSLLGVTRAMLSTPDKMHEKLLTWRRSGDPRQTSIGFAIILDERMIGYTRLNRHAPDVNYSHWHIIEPGLRAGGISSALYPHRIKLYFDAAPITRLIHQTRTRNPGVNRMLDKYVAVAETRYEAEPDGGAVPGEFNLRYVVAADIPRFFTIAASLRKSGG